AEVVERDRARVEFRDTLEGDQGRRVEALLRELEAVLKVTPFPRRRVESPLERDGAREAIGWRDIGSREVLDDAAGGDRSAVDLDDLTLGVQQERRREAQVLAAIEEVAVKDVE